MNVLTNRNRVAGLTHGKKKKLIVKITSGKEVTYH